MKKGILLVAIGHGNYTKMAANLAASIKVNSKIDIALACSTPPPAMFAESGLINSFINVPEKMYVVNGVAEHIKIKTSLYDLSPFDETIFLDVDQIIIKGKDITEVFDELKNVDITFSNTGVAGMSIWADINEVKKIYGDKPYWNFHSEFIYFNKCETVKKYFDAAKKVYRDNKITSAKKFGHGSMSDELAFQAAAMITGTYPHKENWLPNFWFDRHPRLSRKYPYELKEYYTYSIGGNAIPDAVKANYNTLAKYYFAKLGLSNAYQVIDKRSYLPERKTV